MATPLERAPASISAGRQVLLKREDLHELGAFKWRGALPTLEEYRARGATTVVTSSSGNHGAATAWAAQRLGMRAIVYVPDVISRAKLDLIRGAGAEIRQGGRDTDAAKADGMAYAESEGVPFFEDGSEPAQLVGYGEIATEILDQLESPPSAVVVPVGNAALINGIGLVLRERAPETACIAVVAKQAPAMALSYEARRPIDSDLCDTIAEGLAVRVSIPSAVETMLGIADRCVLVTEREIAQAIAAFDAAGLRVEGAAGAALAALPRLRRVVGPIVLIVTGRNIDDDLLERCRTDPGSFPD
jgi:threonine dehydratase